MNIWVKSLIGLVVYFVSTVACMFGLGGNWAWIEGWVFTALFMGVVISVLIALRNNTELLEKRFGSLYQTGQDRRDKVILTLIVIFYVAWFVIVPLDSQRFGWSPQFPLWLIILGAIGFLVSDILLYFTFKQNAFLAPVVKKQEKQRVVSTGLYAHVRHPMYSAMSLMTISGALLLSSLYGIYIAIIAFFLLAARAVLEENKLEKELEGYMEYKRKVKYRLVPYTF